VIFVTFWSGVFRSIFVENLRTATTFMEQSARTKAHRQQDNTEI